jgi:hypothetical protein
VTIDDLEGCIFKLLALARARGIQEVGLRGEDSYWTVPSPEWLEMKQQPALAVGSLADDLAELEKLVAHPERASSIDLDRAAAALRLLSDRLSVKR